MGWKKTISTANSSPLIEDQLPFFSYKLSCLPGVQTLRTKPSIGRLLQYENKHLKHDCKAALPHCTVCFAAADGDNSNIRCILFPSLLIVNLFACESLEQFIHPPSVHL